MNIPFQKCLKLIRKMEFKDEFSMNFLISINYRDSGEEKVNIFIFTEGQVSAIQCRNTTHESIQIDSCLCVCFDTRFELARVCFIETESNSQIAEIESSE